MEFPTVSLIDQLLGFCRKYLSVSLINLADRIGVLVGGWTVYGIAVLLFIAGIVAGIEGDDVVSIIIGFLLLPIGVILHYAAIKMLGAEDRLVSSTPTGMHAEGILQVIAVAAGVIGVIGVPVSIVFGIVEAVDGNFEALITVVFAVFLVYLAALALNPKRIAVNDAGDSSIGQEAIGLATFILKSLYKFVPVLFGVGSVVVAILAIIAIINILQGAGQFAPFIFLQVTSYFFMLCLMPLIAYGLFLLYYVIIDVIRALLSLGGSITASASSKPASSSAGGRPKSGGSKKGTAKTRRVKSGSGKSDSED